MKKRLCLLAAGAALLAAGTMSAHADYAAIAVGPGGWKYVSGYPTMEGARLAARQQCQGLGYGSCSTTTAERSWWSFAVGWCNGDIPYSAASRHGPSVAIQNARNKANQDGYYNCRFDSPNW